MAGHVFVSYSRKDAAYVRELVNHLRGAGVQVWVDTAIDFGDRWENTIKSQVDSCCALIVVMTPDSEESTWVANEIARARSRGKPVMPLLLAGEVFFSLGHTQHENVIGGRMPSLRYVERLQQLAGSRVSAPLEQPKIAEPLAVRLPALGESVTEGTITRWLKPEGAAVVADEPLVEVSTDKVDTEIPAPASGVLVRIVAAEDETVDIGAVICLIATVPGETHRVTVTMPRLGEDARAGTVTRWLKRQGDRVVVDEPLLEVSTDKVDTEIPSPATGTLTQIISPEDATVAVGATLAVIDADVG